MNQVPRGFTLIETVVVIALTTALFLALGSLYLSFNRLYAYQQAFVPSAESARDALHAVTEAVRSGNRVLATAVISGTTHTSGTTTLALEAPAVSATGRVIEGSFDVIVFRLSGTDLLRITVSAAGSVRVLGTKRVAGNVSAVSFTYDAATPALASAVEADVTVSGGAGVAPMRLSQEASLRNL